MESMELDYHVAIIGAGALGSYYGARLVQAGVRVTFLLRSDYDYVSQHGLKVSSIDGDFTVPKIDAANHADAIGEVDLVIIAWKTTANSYYKQTITPLLHDHTKILTLQNGLGSTDQLAGLFGYERVYGMLCFIGVNRLRAGVIDHVASAGPAKVGKYIVQGKVIDDQGLAELRELVTFLQYGGIICELEASLERAQWMKLLWNIPFNGLTISEGGIDTSKLLARDGMEQRIRLIMIEVQAIALALGYSIPTEMIDNQIERTKAMQGYHPSSMIDYLEGREVEVDAIWGNSLQRAQELGVSVPEIEKLHTEITQRLQNE